jgi:hypothetical protein
MVLKFFFCYQQNPGAESISRGLIAGASKTSHYLDKGAAYINSRIEPAREPRVVKPEVKSGMKTAKNVTGKAVKISGFIGKDALWFVTCDILEFMCF